MRLLLNWAIVKEPTLIVTSVVYGLLGWICLNAGILGIPFGILLLASIWRYSYQTMRAVAQGRRRLSPPDIDSFNLWGEWAVFWHFVFFPGVIIATASYQPLGTIVAIAVAIVFPASVALIGVTSSLSQAFNPVAIRHFVHTVGSDYWALVGGTILIFVGSSLLIRLVLPVFGFLSAVVGIMVNFWALFASFALIGSVLRKHRLEFEITGEVKPDEDRQLERRHADWRRDLDIAYASLRSRNEAAGYKTLHDLVDREGDSIEVNFWLVENMLEWEEKRFALEVAAKLIPRLLERGDAAEALELFRRCRRRDPRFRLPDELSARLGEHAAAFGHHGLAGELRYTSKDVQT